MNWDLLALRIGYVALAITALWIGGMVFYSGCYAAAQIVDWFKERKR